MKENWIFRFPVITGVGLGLLVPLIFGYIGLASCPHEAGLAYFPLLSAECPGEYIGTLGFLLSASPGLALIVLLYAFPSLLSFLLDRFQPGTQIWLMSLLCLATNVVTYWAIFEAIRRSRKRVQQTPQPIELPNTTDENHESTFS